MPPPLTIEKLVHGGPGLARTAEGAVVLVPGTLPGERVDAVPDGKRHGVTVASVRAVLEASPDRRAAPCPHFGVCGGCDWLFINYRRQPDIKREIFLESLGRVGKLSGVPDPQVIPSPEFGYRRRAQFKIDSGKRIGFFRRESNDVVPVSYCPLLTERLNALLRRCTDSPEALPDGLNNLRAIDGDTLVASDPPLPGNTLPTTTVSCGGRTLEVGGGDFFQGNRFLLEPMSGWVASHCGGGRILADLYGGTGLFSMATAGLFDSVWLVETDGAMVQRAEANFRRNGIGNIHDVAAPAEEMDRRLPVCRPDALIVDPPRPGLTRKVREAVARRAPGSIIYVSCNCATQARDCGFFVKQAGYAITAAALFDLYPNTHHTETIVVLTHNSNPD